MTPLRPRKTPMAALDPVPAASMDTATPMVPFGDQALNYSKPIMHIQQSQHPILELNTKFNQKAALRGSQKSTSPNLCPPKYNLLRTFVIAHAWETKTIVGRDREKRTFNDPVLFLKNYFPVFVKSQFLDLLKHEKQELLKSAKDLFIKNGITHSVKLNAADVDLELENAKKKLLDHGKTYFGLLTNIFRC